MKELDILIKKMRLKEYQEKYPQNTISLKKLNLSDETITSVRECINRNRNFKVYIKNVSNGESASQSVTFVDTSIKSLSNLVEAFDHTKSQDFEYNTSPSKCSTSSTMNSPRNKRRRLSTELEKQDQDNNHKDREVSVTDLEPVKCSQPHTSTQAFTQPFPLSLNVSPIARDSESEQIGNFYSENMKVFTFKNFFQRTPIEMPQ